MAIEMEYLSHSRMDVFNQCERLFFKRYIEKSPRENKTWDFFATYGTNLHYIVEQFYKNRGLIPKNVLTDWFLNGDTEDEVVGFNKIAMPDRMKNSYLNSGLSFIDRLISHDTSKTIATEQEFLLEVDPSCPPVKGFIDRLDRTNEGIVVIDYKTSKSYGQQKSDILPQVSIYGLAVKQLYNEYPHHYEYLFIRVNDRIVTYRTPAQLEQTRLDIIDTWRRINKSDWKPSYESFYCMAFCDHNASCELYKMMQEKEQYEKQQRKLAKQKGKKS